MFEEFNVLVQKIMNENLGLGQMQFPGQSSYILVKKQKKSASKKKRSKQNCSCKH